MDKGDYFKHFKQGINTGLTRDDDSRKYLSPEMLEYLGSDKGFQNSTSVDMVKSDVYSLGVCVMEIAVMKFCPMSMLDMES